MPRRLLAVLAAVFLLAPFALSASDLLLRVQRRSEGDRSLLQRQGFSLLGELERSLFVRGDERVAEKLQRLGYGVETLDADPRGWEYLLVGLRPDSDLAALAKAGVVLYTEDNVVLMRLWPFADRSALHSARAFFAPLPKEPLPAPVQAQALPARPAGPESAQPLVQQIVNGVSPSDIDAAWEALVPPNPPGTGTRYTASQGCRDAAAYCSTVYQGLGLQVQTQSYKLNYAPNVVATLPGAVTPGEVFIVVGHLDDMPSTGYAPGADDNASGSATVLEAARALSCYSFRSTVKFLNVTGEETGLEGSSYYASDAYARKEDIRGVLNFDMNGWAGDGVPPGENLDLDYDENSQALGTAFAQAASTYGTGLAVDAFLCPSLTASDHYPFWQHGWPAVCGITDNEGYCGHGGSYPYYHTSSDTLANCGPRTFFYSTVKAAVATLADLARPFKILFGSPAYACASTASLVVGDRDLDADPGRTETAAVSVWSTREPAPETVLLTEESADSPFFRGTVALTTAPPVHGDGLVSVSPGDTVTAAYVDAGGCNGPAGVSYTATAAVDCTPPVISGVLVSDVTESSAVVSWTTDEPADSGVTFGAALPPARTADVVELTTGHSVQLTGLAPCTGYLFYVRSRDAAGNAGADDNGGLYFTFSTLGRDYAFGPDDVEAGPGSWTATGQWHIDTCAFASPTHSWKAGSTACPGQYADNTDSYLTSQPFSLGSAGSGYHLRFREWYNTESGYDWCTVQISTNGGSTWTTLGTHYAGLNGAWAVRDFDLSAYSGSAVRVRFWLHADGSIHAEGWYVDDIEVSRDASCELIPMLAVASGSPSSGVVPLSVSFGGNATGGVPPYTFVWDFGDGTPPKTGPSLTHTYAAGGTYPAVLTVSDSAAPVQSVQAAPVQIVALQALGAAASALPSAGVVPLRVTFTGSASGGTPPYAFAWDFGDGTSPAAGSIVEHLYTSPGSFTATLRVTDSAAASAPAPPLTIAALAPLQAAASAAPLSGVAPLQVSFAGTASGGSPPYAYRWDFGDATAPSLEASPTHFYSSAGDFAASLAVTDSASRTASSDPVAVHVEAPLTVTAASDVQSGAAPLTAHFHGEASGGSEPYAFSWDFGDGQPPVAGPDATRTFDAGAYTVRLTVTDAGSPPQRRESSPLLLRVDQPLGAGASATPAAGPRPLTVTYSAQATGGLPPYTFTWSFPDGTPDQTGASVQHTYGARGTYTATVSAADSAEPPQRASASAPAVTATDQLAAQASVSPLGGPAPLAVTCEGSATGGTPPYFYSWSYGDGATGSGPATVHTFAAPGTYSVQVSVTDSSPSPLSTSTAQEVGVYSPLAAVSSGSPLSGVSPLTVVFTGSHTGGLSPYTETWDFGDGTPAVHGAGATHTYTAPGTYSASFTANDGAVPPASAAAPALSVVVFAPLSASASAAPDYGTAPLTVRFEAAPTGGSAPYDCLWDFGDGTHGQGLTASHTYLSPGSYTAGAGISDASGQHASAEVPVAVLAPLSVSVSATPSAGSAPLSVALLASPSGGAPPYSVHWDFGDGSGGDGASLSHAYAAGTYTAAATATDRDGRTATASVSVTAVQPPVVSSVKKLTAPFRLKLAGQNFHAQCEVRIDGAPVPQTQWVSESKVLAKGGSALKGMLPKGAQVQITVVNLDDGGVSAPVPFTR